MTRWQAEPGGAGDGSTGGRGAVRGAPWVVVGLLLATATGMAACGDGPFAAAGSDPLAQPVTKPLVWTTAPSIQAIALQILDRAQWCNVRCLVPDGVDGTNFRPDRAAIAAMLEGDLILMHGAGFEDWAGTVALPASRVVDCSLPLRGRLLVRETVVHSHGSAGQHTHAGVDPRVALDPALVALQGEAVAAALVRLRPEHRAAIDAGLERWRAAVRELEPVVRAAGAASGPWYSAHRSYDYLARAAATEVVDLDLDLSRAVPADRLPSGGTGTALLLCPEPPHPDADAALTARGWRVVVLDPAVGAGDPDGFAAALAPLARRRQ